VLQPYFDILKLLRKETVLPEPAGIVFRVAPYVSFAGYATVRLLIPVLTSFGVITQASAKGLAFFGAGSLLRGYDTKEAEEVTGAATAMPWTGPMFLAAALALCGLPLSLAKTLQRSRACRRPVPTVALLRPHAGDPPRTARLHHALDRGRGRRP
jgi:hypothetical protein